MRLVHAVICGLLAGLLPVQFFGSELVHLRSGFDLEASSHVVSGMTYSFRTSTGTIEIPAADVVDVEIVPDPIVPLESSGAGPKSSSGTDLNALIRTIAISEAGTPEFSRFVRCVAEIESAMHPNAKSPKGAIGLMQLMPDTAKDLGVIASDTEDNIRGGAKYLRELLVQYHSDAVLALAAYNAGPEAVKKYGGVPPYPETRRYIGRVLQEYARLSAKSGALK